nr:crosslink repair DNA glycosylase YcaQ family protein [Phycicoccus sp. HDW14]
MPRQRVRRRDRCGEAGPGDQAAAGQVGHRQRGRAHRLLSREQPAPARHVDDDERRARLARRQGLAGGCGFPDVVAAADALAGLHATEAASVHLAARARVPGVALADVEDALYGRRDVVKQTAMRSTLFAVPRDLLPAVLGGPSARVATSLSGRIARDVERSGVDADGLRWLERARESVLGALGDGELTAPEVREALPDLDVTIDRSPGTRWGATVPVLPQVLWLLTAEGRAVRAGNAGPWRLSKPRFAAAEAWLGARVEPLDPRAAHAEVVGRWLRAFGPGTEDDLGWWLGGTLGTVRAALDDLGAAPVSLDGTDARGGSCPTTSTRSTPRTPGPRSCPPSTPPSWAGAGAVRTSADTGRRSSTRRATPGRRRGGTGGSSAAGCRVTTPACASGSSTTCPRPAAAPSTQRPSG